MGDRDLLSIGIGQLDEPARVRPTFHPCVSSELPRLQINDNLPRFSENTITHPRKRQSPIVAVDAGHLRRPLALAQERDAR